MSARPSNKTVTVRLSIWWNPETRKIHIASNDSETLITTVSDKATNRRGHPKLFRELAKILKDKGKPGPP